MAPCFLPSGLLHVLKTVPSPHPSAHFPTVGFMLAAWVFLTSYHPSLPLTPKVTCYLFFVLYSWQQPKDFRPIQLLLGREHCWLGLSLSFYILPHFKLVGQSLLRLRALTHEPPALTSCALIWVSAKEMVLSLLVFCYQSSKISLAVRIKYSLHGETSLILLGATERWSSVSRTNTTRILVTPHMAYSPQWNVTSETQGAKQCLTPRLSKRSLTAKYN